MATNGPINKNTLILKIYFPDDGAKTKTKTCKSGSICVAAVIALRVNGFSSALLCSAINKDDIILP